jgi:hypothetical protein
MNRDINHTFLLLDDSTRRPHFALGDEPEVSECPGSGAAESSVSKSCEAFHLALIV